MRTLRRPTVSLPTLRDAAGKGYRAAERHRNAWEESGTTPSSFGSHWNEPDVRGALYAMHGRSCAYCQCALPRNDRGDVEHFRPKAHYWWLAYRFENYFLSCSLCNRILKREIFPLVAGTQPLTYAQASQLATEQRLLLDPVDDLIAGGCLRTLWDHDVCKVVVDTEDAVLSARATETIRFFKLNTDPALVKERIGVVTGALDLLERIDNGDDQAREEVRRRASRFAPHGDALRQMLADLAPHLLPDEEQELRWWVDELVADLALLDQLETNGLLVGEDVERQRSELCWALHVVWLDPPVTSRATIESWIGAALTNTIRALDS
ncbi:MAG: hypothetical protein AAGD38_02210 [Acidobacteriota bacterium]